MLLLLEDDKKGSETAGDARWLNDRGGRVCFGDSSWFVCAVWFGNFTHFSRVFIWLKK